MSWDVFIIFLLGGGLSGDMYVYLLAARLYFIIIYFYLRISGHLFIGGVIWGGVNSFNFIIRKGRQFNLNCSSCWWYIIFLRGRGRGDLFLSSYGEALFYYLFLFEGGYLRLSGGVFIGGVFWLGVNSFQFIIRRGRRVGVRKGGFPN